MRGLFRRLKMGHRSGVAKGGGGGKVAEGG